MPLTSADFPPEVQVAFFIYNCLSDVWEGMNGMFLGKDWSFLEYVFDLHEIEDRRVVFFFAKAIEEEYKNYYSEESERRRKAEERKSKSNAGPGKNYSYNVSG